MIEDDIRIIKETLDVFRDRLIQIEIKVGDINEKVDLLTIRKQVDRQSKEKAIKDTLMGC